MQGCSRSSLERTQSLLTKEEKVLKSTSAVGQALEQWALCVDMYPEMESEWEDAEKTEDRNTVSNEEYSLPRSLLQVSLLVDSHHQSRRRSSEKAENTRNHQEVVVDCSIDKYSTRVVLM